MALQPIIWALFYTAVLVLLSLIAVRWSAPRAFIVLDSVAAVNVATAFVGFVTFANCLTCQVAKESKGPATAAARPMGMKPIGTVLGRQIVTRKEEGGCIRKR